jgi:hypothetical protein
MTGGWVDAAAVICADHQAEFEMAYEDALSPYDATVLPLPFLDVRVPDDAHEALLLLGLNGWGAAYRIAAGRFAFPADWEAEVREIVGRVGLRATVQPCVCFHLELRHAGLLDDLRVALLRRAPTFRPTYPSIVVV